MFLNHKNKTKISIQVKPLRKKPASFFDLSSEEQKKIINKVAQESNKEQRELYKKASPACA